MLALRVHEFGNPHQPPRMTYDEVPDPGPAPGQVVVDVEAAGVNPVDTYVASGTYAVKPDLPYTPGMDAAGTVCAVGEGVTELAAGDRVIVIATPAGRLRGAFAEKALCWVRGAPAGEVWPQVWPLPHHLSFAQGAAINVPYVTAFRALFDCGQARRGQTVLIHGATGGVGLAALQIARAHGLRTLATGGSAAGRELLAQQGADVVLDHSAEGYLDALRDDRPHLILEMLANVNLGADLQQVAPHGRVVVIGSRGPVEIEPRLIMGGQLAVTGLTYWSGGAGAVRRAHEALQQGMAAGDIRPVIQAEVPMRDAQRAFDLVMRGGSRGKIVLVP